MRVAGHSTLDGDYGDFADFADLGALGMGLAESADEALELGYLWREDDDLDDGQIAILGADDETDIASYLYEGALGGPQLEPWAGVDTGEYVSGVVSWTRRLSLGFQIMGLIVLLGLSAVSAYALANAVLPSSPVQLQTSSVDAAPKQDGYVISPAGVAGSPTPAEAAGSIGVWVDTSTPGTSASVHAYARVTRNGEAVAAIPVKLDAEISGSTATYGPVTTDSYGIAAFTLNLSGVPAFRPIYLTATTKLADGTEITGQTFFVPR
jgi:hypothetical protein